MQWLVLQLAVTLVQVGVSAGVGFAFLRQSLTAGDHAAIAGPVNLVARPPSMLAAMLDAETATDADERLLPRPVVDPGGVRVARVVTHPGRRLPVVCIYTRAVTAGANANEVAGLLAGLAHVAVASGDAMAEHLGVALAPPAGGARVLWPDVAPAIRKVTIGASPGPTSSGQRGKARDGPSPGWSSTPPPSTSRAPLPLLKPGLRPPGPGSRR